MLHIHCIIIIYPPSDWITVSAQLGAAFAAIVAATVALGIANKPTPAVKFTVNIKVSRDKITTYDPGDLEEAIVELTKRGYGIPKSYGIFFNIRNISGFILKNPIITFDLPVELKHPIPKKKKLSYLSNLMDVHGYTHFEYENRVVLSKKILPIMNDKQELKIWITMCLSKDDKSEYPVKVSLNCDNAEGKTIPETIIPSRLLEGINEVKEEMEGQK